MVPEIEIAWYPVITVIWQRNWTASVSAVSGWENMNLKIVKEMREDAARDNQSKEWRFEDPSMDHFYTWME